MSVRLRKWQNKAGKVEEAWQVDFMFHHPDGRRQRVVKFSPVQTRRGAEQYERELRASLLHGTFGKENNNGERCLTLSEFAPRFLTYSENNNKHSSVVTKRQILDDHLFPFFGNTPLDAIGPAEIEDFKAAMRNKTSAARARKEAPTKAAILKRKDVTPKPLSLKTINNVLSALSKLLALAEEQRVIPQAPRVRLFGKLPKPTFDFLTFEEAERLIDAAGVWIRS